MFTTWLSFLNDWLSEIWLTISYYNEMNISVLQIIYRIFIALIIGVFIGIERVKANKPVGVRTHCLVCVACTMLTMLSAYGFTVSTTDPTRLVSAIIQGIGFLGAGIIWKITEDGKVVGIKGITTAGNLWTIAGLGIAIGLGHIVLAIITAIAIRIIMVLPQWLSAVGIMPTHDDIDN